MLKNKSVLFISPIFHVYHKIICDKLSDMGASVTFFPERDYSFRFKFVNNFFPNRISQFQSGHYDRILSSIKDQTFDYLLVVRGYLMTNDFLRKFRDMNPSAETIMYQWDSNRTNPFESVINDFDKVFSFDYEDCKNFEKLVYLPLFYTDDVLENMNNRGKNEELLYDFFFMGTYFPDRYKALLKFRDFAFRHGYRLKSYLYIPKTSLLKEKLKGVSPDRSVVSTRHMSRSEYLKFLSQSKSVVDVSNKGQTGLAMRVIEALTSRKKVVTSNPNISREPFFDHNNICIYNVDNPDIPSGFLETGFSGQSNTLSIKEWLEFMFRR